MDSLPINLDPRRFQALLSCLIKKNFNNQTEITVSYLANELYESSEDLDISQIENEIRIYEKVRKG